LRKKKVLLVNNYVKNPLKIKKLSDEIYSIIGDQPLIIDIKEVNKIIQSEFDYIVLSGGESPLNRIDVGRSFESISSWIRKINIPVLGICFGHQLIGFAYGSRIARLNKNFEGFYDIDIDEENNIFRELPKTIKVYKSNSRIVAKVMNNFKVIASSKDCILEAFQHLNLPIYGVQFHPEYYDKNHFDGRIILENFFNLSIES
jgi:GMP synthase (glutamine-hydrolysing)